MTVIWLLTDTLFANSRHNRDQCTNHPCVFFMLTPASTVLSNVENLKSEKIKTFYSSR